ncbi:MAG: HDOD domain-containing protein [bacterium]|nr:HDOD domain-containing protein [bacterium]
MRKINALIEDPDVGTAEIGAVVAEDAPLAAKVLRIANSAYYGLQGDCVSTEQASTVLGLRVLRSIVTQAAVFDRFEDISSVNGFSFEEMWQHSLRVAHTTQAIARRSRVVSQPTPDEFYVCGLVHDIGKVIMIDGLGADYARCLNRARRYAYPLHLVEREEFEFSHTDVGSIVAARWDLPEKVCHAIQYHHGPREKVEQDPVISLIAHANLWVHGMEQDSEDAARAVFDEQVREQLGLTEEHIDEILEHTLAIWTGAG